MPELGRVCAGGWQWAEARPVMPAAVKLEPKGLS